MQHFGAGLRDIMFVWAPLSFAGRIFALTIDLIVTVIRLWMMRNDNSNSSILKGDCSWDYSDRHGKVKMKVKQ